MDSDEHNRTNSTSNDSAEVKANLDDNKPTISQQESNLYSDSLDCDNPPDEHSRTDSTFNGCIQPKANLEFKPAIPQWQWGSWYTLDCDLSSLERINKYNRTESASDGLSAEFNGDDQSSDVNKSAVPQCDDSPDEHNRTANGLSAEFNTDDLTLDANKPAIPQSGGSSLMLGGGASPPPVGFPIPLPPLPNAGPPSPNPTAANTFTNQIKFILDEGSKAGSHAPSIKGQISCTQSGYVTMQHLSSENGMPYDEAQSLGSIQLPPLPEPEEEGYVAAAPPPAPPMPTINSGGADGGVRAPPMGVPVPPPPPPNAGPPSPTPTAANTFTKFILDKGSKAGSHALSTTKQISCTQSGYVITQHLMPYDEAQSLGSIQLPPLPEIGEKGYVAAAPPPAPPPPAPSMPTINSSGADGGARAPPMGVPIPPPPPPNAGPPSPTPTAANTFTKFILDKGSKAGSHVLSTTKQISCTQSGYVTTQHLMPYDEAQSLGSIQLPPLPETGGKGYLAAAPPPAPPMPTINSSGTDGGARAPPMDVPVPPPPLPNAGPPSPNPTAVNTFNT